MSRDHFILGDWNAICDRCGRKKKASAMRKTWQGWYVCAPCWEPRHPQDFAKGIVERPVPPWVRPPTEGYGETPFVYPPPQIRPPELPANVTRAEGGLRRETVETAGPPPSSEPPPVAPFTMITFSEFSLGTLNPQYVDAVGGTYYAASAGPFTVGFGSFFVGQSVSGSATNIVGDPTTPFAFTGSRATTITNDTSRGTTSPCLSGSPLFNGSIAGLFSVDVYGFAFDLGFFNEEGIVRVDVYARDGSLLLSVIDEDDPIYYSDLVDTVDTANFRQFSIVSRNPSVGIAAFLVSKADTAGYALDNFRLTDSITTYGSGDITRVPTSLFP